MTELNFSALSADGEHVVLNAKDGTEYLLPITEELRLAVRRDRAKLESVIAERKLPLSPREIQERIRGGLSPAELAAESGIDEVQIQRFAGAVLDERAHIARLAQQSPVTALNDTPPLGDLVAERLATRQVAPGDIVWDAIRDNAGRWVVTVDFPIGPNSQQASWIYEPKTRGLTSQDDEARWLSETELLDTPLGGRRLAPVRELFVTGADSAHSYEISDAPASEALSQDLVLEDPTEALIDSINSKRGVREPLEAPEDFDAEPFEGFGPVTLFARSAEPYEDDALSIPAAHPRLEDPDSFTDATVLPRPKPRSISPVSVPSVASAPSAPAPVEQAPEPAPKPARPAKDKKGRAAIPSWDEIVFGAKTD